MFPPHWFTPMEKIVEVVKMILDPSADEQDKVDGDGEKLSSGEPQRPFVGQAIEVNCDKHYFRQQHEFADEISAATYSM